MNCILRSEESHLSCYLPLKFSFARHRNKIPNCSFWHPDFSPYSRTDGCPYCPWVSSGSPYPVWMCYFQSSCKSMSILFRDFGQAAEIFSGHSPRYHVSCTNPSIRQQVCRIGLHWIVADRNRTWQVQTCGRRTPFSIRNRHAHAGQDVANDMD